jgi:hypothetical protein
MRASGTSSLPPLVSKFGNPLCFRFSFVLEFGFSEVIRRKELQVTKLDS